MTDNDLNVWLNTPPPPTESAACFNDQHDSCRDERCPCRCGHPLQWLLAAIRRGAIIERAIDRTNEDYRHVATMATVRAALFDTFDGNTLELAAHDCKGHQTTDDEADENRYKFVDAVIKRIAELQSPPHNMDARLLEELRRGRTKR